MIPCWGSLCGSLFVTIAVVGGTVARAVSGVWTWSLPPRGEFILGAASFVMILIICSLAIWSRISSSSWFVIAVLLYWCVYILPIALAPDKSPSLPQASMVLKTGARMNGQLLGHSSGAWYLLSGHKRMIEVVPDTAVKSAAIH